ncbi:hypothetical protein GPECTOR_17g828 [Gonium pectorale]|uniref:Fluoride ion transporter CrcB n=1 Tax=Gonium pectorale TaxID=33097 RepID=A0A150GK84_GONPE|nr:hypothetical protein GPECTOR_17g828 [Gonium pectorale]|eukprot:KXZ50191.1 hypothetical protein GPECTOR_17g828 [Gonium pectorale]
MIGKLFGGPCSVPGNWSWAPCVTGSGLLRIGGALFYDFPANVLGSFFIGLFSTGSTLASTYLHVHTPEHYRGLQLLFLPRSSSLQSHVALHFGLRTGYCGSLTTFSSWMLQVVVLMVGRSAAPSHARGTEWVAGLWAIFLGAAGSLLALVVGQHTALAAAAALEDAAATRRQRGNERPGDQPQPGAGGVGGTDGAKVQVVSAANGAHEAVTEERPGGGTGSNGSNTGGDGPAAAPPAVVSIATGPALTRVSASAAVPTPIMLPPGGGAGAGGGAAAAAAARDATVAVPYSAVCLLADIAAGAVLLTLTGVSLAYVWLDREGFAAGERRFWWFAILLGPPGCVLRWYLARFNSLPSRWSCCGALPSVASGTAGGGAGAGRGWSWLQLGTFVANLSACVLNYVADALLFRLGGSWGPGGPALSGTQREVLQGLMVGTAGCLSTVSTWVVELEVLARTSPFGAYKYATSSVGLAVALGLLVYGIPAWTSN